MLYLDTSAAAKLLLPEPESAALRAHLEASGDSLATSEITVIELRRVALRRDADASERALVLLQEFDLVALTTAVRNRAATLLPAMMRSLDAIHVASALDLTGPTSFVTYDIRMREAAELAGLAVVSPGQP